MPLIALSVVLLAAILAILLVEDLNSGSSSGSGSGIAATQPRALPAFSGIELAGDNNVVVHVGGRQAVVVHGDSNLLRRVTTVVRSHHLLIDAKPGNLSSKTPLYVTVEVPSLSSVRLSGAGNLSVTGVHSERLSVALPGDGTISATGTVGTLTAAVGGTGDAVLAGLSARDATATLSGTGMITVRSTRRLEATLSGTGTILYSGNPTKVVTKFTGTGTITPSAG